MNNSKKKKKINFPEYYDELFLKNDQRIRKILLPDEKVILSAILYKFNKRNKRQERTLLITNQHIFNLSLQNIMTVFLSYLHTPSIVKRKIHISKLNGFTVSDTSSEFVIHIKNEYDYRFSSPERRDRILKVLTSLYLKLVPNDALAFYFKPHISLREFTTTEDDLKANMRRTPKGSVQFFTGEDMKQKIKKDKQKVKKINQETKIIFTKNKDFQTKVAINDFNVLKVLGRGAFGKVMLVQKKDTKKLYAIKSLHKEDILQKDLINHTKTERYVLGKINNPFLTNLEYAFQSEDKIYYVMTFMRGGDLFHHLRKIKRFDENRARFYAAETVLAIEYLHNMNILYRDLKPENVLLDDEGHVCLTDFGMGKILEEGQLLTTSFVGTPEYLAPEIIQMKGHSKGVDWWSLGIFIHEMIIGAPPFYTQDQNQAKLFKMIIEDEPIYSDKISISIEGIDILSKLLKKDPEQRLGVKGAKEIKSHPWFASINWEQLQAKKVKPPFKPKILTLHDVDNFDDEFTQEEPVDSIVNSIDDISMKKFQFEFRGFSFSINPNKE